jgi:hypothetical protein
MIRYKPGILRFGELQEQQEKPLIITENRKKLIHWDLVFKALD